MVAPSVTYPEAVDVFLPLLDGWTPITPLDLNLHGAVMRRIEEVLGAGDNIVFTAPSTYGPKAANSSLADRLDAFLELDGTLRDMALVTGSAKLGEFQGDTAVGKFVGFGKTLSVAGDGVDSYMVLFDCRIQGSVDEGGTEFFDSKVPCLWWTNQKIQTGCWIAARTMKGSAIDPSDSTVVEFCLLAIGYDNFSTG